MASIKSSKHRKEIEAIIIGSRFNGLSYMDIANRIEAETGEQVSHTTVSNHWRGEMSGDVVDQNIKQLNEVAALGGVGAGAEITEAEIKPFLGDAGFIQEAARLRARLIVLIGRNIEGVAIGEVGLRRDYTAALRDLQAVLKTSIEFGAKGVKNSDVEDN